MYKFAYAELLDETPKLAREREVQAIERSIALLEAAQVAGPKSRESVEAIHFVNRLWSIFIEDLARAENDLPKELRANLISVGLWIMKETDSIRNGHSKNFKGIVEVSQIISEGLRG